MSLIRRSAIPYPRHSRVLGWFGPACYCALLFLLNIDFGAPPSTSLDASWTEVLAWARLHSIQWGRDIAFTYGPLGFLHGRAGYVPGILPDFFIGQILLNAAFAVIVTLLLQRMGKIGLALFAIAYLCSYPYVPSDVSWAMTLIFGTVLLLNSDASHARWIEVSVMLVFALLSGAIALIKFSMFPLWLLCWFALAADRTARRTPMQALWVLAVFPTALLVVWMGSGQAFDNLLAFLNASFHVAAGYGHAMGASTSLIVQFAGATCLVAFLWLCLLAAYQRRSEIQTLLVAGLSAAAAFVFWRTGYTRADHAPWFFASFSLLPFALLSHQRLSAKDALRSGLTVGRDHSGQLRKFAAPPLLRMRLIVLAVACGMAGLFGPSGGLGQRWAQISSGLHDHWYALTHPTQMQAQKDAQWRTAQSESALPQIRQRVGSHTIDLFTHSQGALLLNELNYSPRPIFQSYSAYTPYLARLNEAFLLGPHAPHYVLLNLETIDGRLPMGDDSLALIALLERYRPVLHEGGYLLLQQITPIAPPPVTPPTTWTHTALGKEVAVTSTPGAATIAFAKIDLSLLGRLYAFLLREPVLRISTQSDTWTFDDRFIRPSAAAGFVLSPMIRSTQDWTRLQLGAAVRQIRSLRIQPEQAWQEIFFERDFRVGFETRAYQHYSPADAPHELMAEVYPGFNRMPSHIHGASDIIDEGGKPALFLHAPGALLFAPEPGRYRLIGEFGIRNAALTTPACAAADGIGLSVDTLRNGKAERLLHLELDPFHTPADRGAQQLDVNEIDIESGDQVKLRIDPGHGGGNTACDWSYVRDVQFELLPKSGKNAAAMN